MPSRTARRILATAVAATSFAAFTPAQAVETIDISYHVPFIGIALTYIGMGYENAAGNYESLAGQQIVSARVVLDFTPAPGVDWSSIHMDMAVPVVGAQSQFFSVLGTQLVETTPGTYHYELTTDMFNGTIVPGRFGIESYGATPDGGISLSGSVSASTGFYFTVTSPNATPPVPEPASVALLLAGLAVVPVVAKRMRRDGEQVVA